MSYYDHKKFIHTSYEDYKRIGYVECPAFNDERVYFLKRGFRHLIWKGVKLRTVDEQIERINLLKYAPLILRTSKFFKDFNKNNIEDHTRVKIDFWSFSQVHERIEIIVLVRQINDKPKHFFSIMKRDK